MTLRIMRFWQMLLVFMCFLCGPVLAAPQEVIIKQSTSRLDLDGPFLTAPEINGVPDAESFTAELYTNSNQPGSSPYWHKIPISYDFGGVDGVTKTLNLIARFAVVRHVEVNLYRDGMFYKQVKLGALDSPEFQGFERPVFRFELKQGHEYELLIRKDTLGPANLSMVLLDDYELTRLQNNRHAMGGIYFFSAIGFLLYSALVSVLSKNKTSINYLVFYLYTILSTLSVNGLSLYLLPEPAHIFLNTNIHTISIVGIMLLCLMAWRYLSKDIIQSKKQYFSVMWMLCGALGMSILTSEDFGFYVFAAAAFIGGIYITKNCVSAMQRGSRTGKFLMLIWVLVVSGSFVNILNMLGLLPTNNYTVNSHTFHMMVIALLLTVAVTDWAIFEAQRRTIQAYKDPVTGLPLHSFMLERIDANLGREIRKANGDAWIFVVKITGTASLSKVFGLEASREIKEQFISRLKHAFIDMPGVVSMPISSQESTKFISVPGENVAFLINGNVSITSVKRKMAILDTPFLVSGIEVEVSVHAGYDRFYDHNNKIQTSLSNAYVNANQALITALREGSKYQAYEEVSNASRATAMSMAQDLTKAIKNKELDMHIQPQFLANGDLAGGEVLVRWKNNEFGYVPPSSFIVLAEEAGMIFGITRLMIEKAFTWVSENRNILPDNFHLSINLSVMDVQNSALHLLISGCLKRYNINPDLIVFEITETAGAPSIEALSHGIAKLKRDGFKIAVDDFGTGYSSISHLKEISPDYLKIDMSFIQGIDKSALNQKFVESIVGMAKAVDCYVIAEGVEIKEDLDMALSLGSHLYQGFISGRPIPAESFSENYLIERAEAV